MTTTTATTTATTTTAPTTAPTTAAPANAAATLDSTQQLLIEQRVSNESKSAVVAYLLMVCGLGLLGGHRFYFGRSASGALMMLLTLSVFGLIITGPWLLIDALSVPSMARAHREALRRQLTRQLTEGEALDTRLPSEGSFRLTPSDQSGWAVAGSCFGFFSLVLGIFAPLALIFGLIALFDIRRAERAGRELGGRGRAIFAIVTSVVGPLITLGLFAIVMG